MLLPSSPDTPPPGDVVGLFHRGVGDNIEPSHPPMQNPVHRLDFGEAGEGGEVPGFP